jgi:hypothetical protein
MSSALPILKTDFETDCPEVEKDEGPALFGCWPFLFPRRQQGTEANKSFFKEGAI